jgi:hypothetical protein
LALRRSEDHRRFGRKQQYRRMSCAGRLGLASTAAALLGLVVAING